LPELGIDFIDAADSYGPDVSEQLIREALHPYSGIVVATQAGFQRAKLVAAKSGKFRIGGEIEINRLGFSAMRITGEGI
jgi:aryl-alcohol dehydrogenase-like predicted oxidoreductase